MTIAASAVTAIIINAGQGSRLLPLTETMPKCLVEVDGRPILDHQLVALAKAGVKRALIIGGYRIDQIAAHLTGHRHAIATDLALNPFWAVAGAIGSVWAARDRLAEPFLLMNGDTLFDAKLFTNALDQAEDGVSLLAEPLAMPGLDDMLVEVADGRVTEVSKSLDAGRATHRSLGVILSSGGTTYREALEATIRDDVHAFHHAVVARLAHEGLARAVIADRSSYWQEIDRPEDIALWSNEHREAAAGT